jgi:hypothetical protein
MRLWSIHPKYLDSKGLVALWREALLAQKVLQGKTKGYRHHPQLVRFQADPSPKAAIKWYLYQVWRESKERGYSFQRHKVAKAVETPTLPVTRGQLQYEWKHLRKKLKRRNPALLKLYPTRHIPRPHPSFRVVPGKAEKWEKLKSRVRHFTSIAQSV